MSLIIVLHVIPGIIAVLAGFLALLFKKGSPIHKFSGKVFLGFMLFCALMGGIYGLILPNQILTFFVAILTIYLMLTSWLAVHPLQKKNRISELILSGLIFINSTSLLYLAFLGSKQLDNFIYGYHFGAYLFMAVIGLIALLFDVLRLNGKLMSRKASLCRHIWRIGFVYFIAVGSLFTGLGADQFPSWIKGSIWLELPEPFVLLFTFYWLVKMGFVKKL